MEVISLKPLSRFSSLPLHGSLQPKPPLLSISFSLTPPHPRKPPPLKSLRPRSDAPPIPSLSLLLPALRSASGFVLSRARKFRSCLRGGLGDAEYEAFGTACACGGGIGTVLMSTTAAAAAATSRAQTVRPFLLALAANPTFVSGLVAWALAQTMKVLLNFFVEWRWDFGMLFNSGGMPSSHSALCMALTSSVAICHGIGDALFPVCLGFSLIVMYDAIGVRRHAGMQAEVLNKIVEDLFQAHPISQRKLKELLGHTPSQVIAGALLGIIVACICCRGCVVAI